MNIQALSICIDFCRGFSVKVWGTCLFISWTGYSSKTAVNKLNPGKTSYLKSVCMHVDKALVGEKQITSFAL